MPPKTATKRKTRAIAEQNAPPAKRQKIDSTMSEGAQESLETTMPLESSGLELLTTPSPATATNATITSSAAVSATQKRRRAQRGLRQFSHKVCEKVQQKGTTTYMEVAKELVDEYAEETKKDAKNIRRRVYDALNVLLAMDIITKEKKQITWKGYPANVQMKREGLVRQRENVRRTMEQRKKQYEELQSQNEALKALYERNKKAPQVEDHDKVKMPFIIVHTSKETIIECQMDTNATEVFFNFTEPFEIHNDSELLMHIFHESKDPFSHRDFAASALTSSQRTTTTTTTTTGKDLSHSSVLVGISEPATPVRDHTVTPRIHHLTAHSMAAGLSPGRPLFTSPGRFPSSSANHHRDDNILADFSGESIPFPEAPADSHMLMETDFSSSAEAKEDVLQLGEHEG
mmetsp:Transcript_10619/g.39601  ORF Transcript_10619/g.39601 Transcript_10619/m.39601 type:complete len:403 (-) Transcript_10619:61-1269(-)|eukprot:CAMPEP_0117442096 /NCGR_PEP_ID=MMETSP0759-20121206/3974_1 /TAXON_ID=63605 /ORGANISM="Percolomonas cosmopolitus, Strain WS" /LENGTH=402 /DNA_ID=CAMNT_0005233971 /DNA_START=344 /DNA_END=1552 /DNA_ORIENTATION=+